MTVQNGSVALRLATFGPPGQPPAVDGNVRAVWRLLGGILTAEEEDVARVNVSGNRRFKMRSMNWLSGEVVKHVNLKDSKMVAHFIMVRDECIERGLTVVDQRKKQRVDEMLLCRADPQHADKLQKVLLIYPQHGIFLQICITCYVKKENVIPRVSVGISEYAKAKS